MAREFKKELEAHGISTELKVKDRFQIVSTGTMVFIDQINEFRKTNSKGRLSLSHREYLIKYENPYLYHNGVVVIERKPFTTREETIYEDLYKRIWKRC